MIPHANAPRHFAWICGWSIAPADFAAAVRACWPHDTHAVFAPDAHALDQVRAEPADIVAGYSFGALLLLSANDWPADLPLLAIAPFIAFDAEAGLGGTTPQATRLALRARLDRTPAAAIKVFHRLAGLPAHQTHPLPVSPEALAWGLDALGTLRASPLTTRRARLHAGTDDPLIDLTALRAQAPHLHDHHGLGHDFNTLLPAVARHE